MPSDAATLSLSATAALTVRPLAPGQSGANLSLLPAPAPVIGLNGANVRTLEVDGAGGQILLGKANNGGYNGLIGGVDMTGVRGIYITCPENDETLPDWTGEAGTSITVAFTADCGTVGSAQTALAAEIHSWTYTRLILAGDFSYTMEASGATGLNADVAVWAADLTGGQLRVIAGNHEADRGSGYAGLLNTKFTSVQTNYASEDAENGYSFDEIIKGDAGDPDPLLHIFYIDPMLKSDGTNLKTASNEPVETGKFRDWLESRLAAYPGARYRVAVMHYPAVSSVERGGSDNGTFPDYAWLLRLGIFDLVINGHSHACEAIEYAGGSLALNCSNAVQTIRPSGNPLEGATGGAALIFASDVRTAGRFTATPDALTWEIVEVGGGIIASGQKSPRKQIFGGYEVKLLKMGVVAGGTEAGAGDIVFRMSCGDSLYLTSKMIQPCVDDVESGITVTDRNATGFKLKAMVVGA